MKTKKKLIITATIIVLLVIVFSIYWLATLQIAHSTFDNYYKFRGCTELINKTDDYGYCKLKSGETIKLVKYNDKWYLDNDLPVSCGPINCP